jgi:Co/Zn/Cd efflux system component
MHDLHLGTPKNLNCLDIQNELSRFDGVKRIHNLHIWSLGTDHFALSVHLVIEDENKSIRITKNASTMLKEKYGIHYATVQTELPDPMPVEDCNYCLPLS